MNDVLSAVKIKPRLAFIGAGWIGFNRMKALLEHDLCKVVAIMDTAAENADRAMTSAPEASICDTWEDLLRTRPDGIVIATPSALHADQSLEALKAGIPVFCQKPLARTASETKAIIEAAQRANKLLGIDLSYRYTDGMQKIAGLTRNNELGKIFAVDLVFYNAYGPDKAWFYNPKLSGGGCLIDLGIHLVDLAMWILNFPEVIKAESTLVAKGQVINGSNIQETEDYVSAQFETVSGTVVRLACSWNLAAGKDAEIKASFYGTRASALLSNIGGSFYDFETSLCYGTSAKVISSPPDEWGGRALMNWARKLQLDNSFDPEILNYNKVATVIDQLYGR